MDLNAKIAELQPLIGLPRPHEVVPATGDPIDKPSELIQVEWRLHYASALFDTGLWKDDVAPIPLQINVLERIIHGGALFGLADKHDYAAEMIVGDTYRTTAKGPSGKFTVHRGPDDLWRIVGLYDRTDAGLYVNGSKL
jgi:hypothetical protein